VRTLKLFQAVSVFYFRDVRSADAWNKTKFCFVSADDWRHCLTADLFQTSAHPWNKTLKQFYDCFSLIICGLKNMLIRPPGTTVPGGLMKLKQFQCFISVLFHHVRRFWLTFSPKWFALLCGPSQTAVSVAPRPSVRPSVCLSVRPSVGLVLTIYLKSESHRNFKYSGNMT